MNLKNLNLYFIITSVLAKALSAFGVLIFQLLLSRSNSEEAVGQFSSILSILFLVGIVARWGSAEVLFKDARSFGMDHGKDNLNIYIFKIMYQCLIRGVLITASLAGINYIILPAIGLNSLIDNKFYYFWFIAPLFSLTSLNANSLYLQNKNIMAGLSEPGGIALISSLLVFIGLLFSLIIPGTSAPFFIYAFVMSLIAAIPIILLIFSTRLKSYEINQPLIDTHLLQTTLFVYFGQWGIVVALTLMESLSIVGIFAVCLQLSVLLDFFIRVAGSVYAHRIRYAYETMTKKDFANQIQLVSRAVAVASGFIFVILLNSAEFIYDIFSFTDERFFFIFYVLILARFANSLFGLTDSFLIMTKFQREYKWIIIISSSIALFGALLSSVFPIEVVASMVAVTIVLRNTLASIVIYKRSGLIMIPFFVLLAKKNNES